MVEKLIRACIYRQEVRDARRQAFVRAEQIANNFDGEHGCFPFPGTEIAERIAREKDALDA